MNLSGTVAAVVLPLALSGCAGATDAGQTANSSAGQFESAVDVDTPQLRVTKKQAGVEDCAPGEGSAPTGQGLPDVTLACLGGGPDVNLGSLQGPMVINLWAQWCGPCRDELPFYQQLHERAPRVEVLGIDYQDTQPDAALELVQETGVTYPLLADPAARIRVPFKVRGLPGIVFVDEQGRVAHIEYTVIGSYGQLRDLVEKHLGVPVPVGSAG